MNRLAPLKKIPDTLLYRPPQTNSFRMFNTKTGDFLGEMILDKRESEMFVRWLDVKPEHRRQGVGTKFLDFAKNISKSFGFEGRLRLMASVMASDIKNPPHIFYRKYGFTSDDKKMLSRIDKLIKKHKQLDTMKALPLYMYYDPNLVESKSNTKNIISKVLDYIM